MNDVIVITMPIINYVIVISMTIINDIYINHHGNKAFLRLISANVYIVKSYCNIQCHFHFFVFGIIVYKKNVRIFVSLFIA